MPLLTGETLSWHRPSPVLFGKDLLSTRDVDGRTDRPIPTRRPSGGSSIPRDVPFSPSISTTSVTQGPDTIVQVVQWDLPSVPLVWYPSRL